jgi:hypothetical protein
MEEDLIGLTRDELLEEVVKLRRAIRAHRDSSAQIAVPAWPQFMRGCVRYRQSLDQQLPEMPRSDREFEPSQND